jgi:hypothetical protein
MVYEAEAEWYSLFFLHLQCSGDERARANTVNARYPRCHALCLVLLQLKQNLRFRQA